MGTFFVYSLKAGLCLAMFYLLYKLLLSKETFHSFNRGVILSAMLLSLAIPLVHITVESTPYTQNGMAQIEVMVMQASVPVAENGCRSLTTLQALFIIYIIGVAFFLARDVLSVARLRRLMRRGRVVNRQNGITIVALDEDVSPFSWFNYIVIGDTDYRDNAHDIIIHETAHARRHHSVDILLCNLLIAFQWYNPAAWLLKRELQDIHEYEADAEVLSNGIDEKHYQLLLIRKSVGEKFFSMANNMNHNSLKKRITMMKTRKSNVWNRLKVVVALPASALAVVAFASPKAESVTQTMAAEADNMVSTVTRPLAEGVEKPVVTVGNETVNTVCKSVSKSVAAQDSSFNENVLDLVEQPPQFPGGMSAFMEYLRDNVKYPAEAKANKIEGRVIVSFIVNEDGTATSPKVARSVESSLDAEALRVISAMPKWQPGRQDGKPVSVRYAVPVTFRLQLDKNVMAEETQQTKLADKKIVYVIDGKKSTEADMRSLDPSMIKEMQVVKKGDYTVQTYGEEARDGAIFITTKK